MTRSRRTAPTARGLWIVGVLALCGIGGCGAPGEVPEAAAPELPSVKRAVLVTIDTLRNDYVGKVLLGRAVTPRLDALAARGVRFTQTISPVPITLPAHSTLLTGLEPVRHGVRANAIFVLSDEIPTLASRFQAEGISTAAFVGARVLDRRYGLARGFDVYDDEMGFRRAFGSSGYAERRADQVVDSALEWLEARPDRFFAWVHVYDPHLRHAPPRKFQYAFPSDPYAAEVHFADAQVGRLIDAVEAAYPDGRTLFVVTSDHGESRGEHGDPTHSYTLYDATQLVPLILAGARVPAGRSYDAVVRLSDVAPTVAEAMGFPFEGDAELDGASLAGLIESGAGPPRTAWVETLATKLEFGWSPMYGVRTDRFKYVRAPRSELYAVDVDPDELVDLSAELPEIAHRLDAEVEARLARGVPIRPGDAPTGAERAQLEALGYVIPTSTDLPDDVAEVGGPDPKDHVSSIQQLATARQLSSEGKHAEALAAVESIDGAGHHLLTYQVRFARLAGELEKAEAYARNLIREAPSWADGHLELGLVLIALERPGEAKGPLTEAARLDPARSDAQLALAVIALRREDFDETIAQLEAAMESRDRNVEVLWRLASMRAMQDRPEEAQALLDQLPPGQRHEPEVIRNLVAGDLRAGHPDRARKRVRRAILRNPGAKELRELLVTLEEEAAARAS